MNQEDFNLRKEKWLKKVSDRCHEIAIKDENYPDFYVFQSEIIFNPNLLIIAANPHGDVKYKGMMAKKGIERRTKDHLCNSRNMYIDNPDWEISKPILQLFGHPRLIAILKNSVIMNAIYFNTNKVADLKKFAHGNEMINTCQNLTKEFVYTILKPKNILFLGEDAPKWMSIKFNHIENSVLRNNKEIPLIKKVIINEIPHYKIHHPSRNWSFNSGENLKLKKKFFEDVIFSE